MWGMLSILSILAAVFLSWNLYRRFTVDQIAALSEKRRSSSRLVSRGEFIDGNRHIDVALALTRSSLYYENADMEASLELEWVSDIEYDGRVLRVRCYSRTFEFVLPKEAVSRWLTLLPPRHGMEAAAAVGV